MLLSDGKDQLLFDAPFTRANPLHWLNLYPLKSDEKIVKEILSHHKINGLKGIFVSHHHVDHAVDVGMIAKLTGARAIGDENLRRLIPEAQENFQKMTEGEEIRIGEFTVIPFKIQHGEIPLEFLFKGEVPKDFNFSLYDYKEGNTWFYLITNEEKSILWNGSTGNAIQVLRKKGIEIEPQLYVLGMGALNLKGQIEKLNGNHPFKSFIPVHFDNFFFPYDREKFILLPFSSIQEDITRLRKDHPEVEWILPELGKAYEI